MAEPGYLMRKWVERYLEGWGCTITTRNGVVLNLSFKAPVPQDIVIDFEAIEASLVWGKERKRIRVPWREIKTAVPWARPTPTRPAPLALEAAA